MRRAGNGQADLKQTKMEIRESKIAIFYPLSSILDDDWRPFFSGLEGE